MPEDRPVYVFSSQTISPKPTLTDTIYGDIATFRIFKMATADILDFWNSDILLSIGVQRVETHQHVKFRQNWLIGCEDIKIKIFRFFSRWRRQPSWIRLAHIWTAHSE